ncbi:MAG: 2-C-methyl-D-erythritol 4-phosphate cytidylyltransferase [Lachnospiraceae bacterium]|nr:2-C-methyl-D-erythritol 4-phosphate cytidylyltransferase [Lachnospiraceae bacterium]
MEHVTGIVLAAGKGSRMHLETPKQFLMVDEKPLLYYSLKVFEESTVDDIVLVTNEEYVEFCQRDIIEKYHIKKVKKIVTGGSERYWSVWNGLVECRGTDYVLIHDAARPCLTAKMIYDSILKVRECGACTMGVPVKDTIKVVNEKNEGIDTPPRESLWQIQTPQSFLYDDLVAAYEKMKYSGDRDITDDTMIIERYLGKKTSVVKGNYCNIKVTTPEDLLVVEIFLKKMKKAVDTDESW